MSPILAPTQTEQDQIQALLDKDIPSYRQAYSDRTAWIMACISELTYLRFDPLFKDIELKDYFVEAIGDLIDKAKDSSLLRQKTALLKLIDMVGYNPLEEKRKLVEELKSLRMELVATFDKEGTQAILVNSDNYLTLSFRGSDAHSIQDIKTDARAKQTAAENGGRIHEGFKLAFAAVRAEIQAKLDEKELRNKPLFITGHSLGGALATVAARELNHQGGMAACYTFGSPRVGDQEWIVQFKTPVYRLVNAADCITMLPPGNETITIVSWLAQFIPAVGRQLQAWLLATFGGYMHGGNMRYLTNCPTGEYSGVQLLYSVSFWYRLKGFVYQKLPWKTFLADHAIVVYRRKLEVIAHNRNFGT